MEGVEALMSLWFLPILRNSFAMVREGIAVTYCSALSLSTVKYSLEG